MATRKHQSLHPTQLDSTDRFVLQYTSTPHTSRIDADVLQWDSLMNINLRGNFFVAREVAKRLVEHKRPGSIVNVASILGLRPGMQQVMRVHAIAPL